MIVSWPKKIKRGTSDALMSQVDFVRSFETFFNQPAANDYAKDSEDNLKPFWSVKLGQNFVGRTRWHPGHGRNEWKYIEPFKGPAILQPMNIESGYSLKPHLYNLKEDISEQHNLAETNPAMLTKLAAMLKVIKEK